MAGGKVESRGCMRHGALAVLDRFGAGLAHFSALNVMRCALTCTPTKLGLARPRPAIGCKQIISGAPLRSASSARHVLGGRGEGRLSSLGTPGSEPLTPPALALTFPSR